jgi:hypothetical protein
MRIKQLDIRHIAARRLTALACENLPIPVRERIVNDFVIDAEKKLNRLARRQITIPRIAKIFTASMQPQEGANEGGVQPPPLFEMGHADEASGESRHGP